MVTPEAVLSDLSVRVFRLFLSSTFLRHSDCVVAKRSLSWALPVQTTPARGLQSCLAAARQMGNVCACGEVVVTPRPRPREQAAKTLPSAK